MASQSHVAAALSQISRWQIDEVQICRTMAILELVPEDSSKLILIWKESEALEIAAQGAVRTAFKIKEAASENVRNVTAALMEKDVIDIVSADDGPYILELGIAGWRGHVRILPQIAPVNSDEFGMNMDDRIAMVETLIQNGINVHPETLASLPERLRIEVRLGEGINHMSADLGGAFNPGEIVPALTVRAEVGSGLTVSDETGTLTESDGVGTEIGVSDGIGTEIGE